MLLDIEELSDQYYHPQLLVFELLGFRGLENNPLNIHEHTLYHIKDKPFVKKDLHESLERNMKDKYKIGCEITINRSHNYLCYTIHSRLKYYIRLKLTHDYDSGMRTFKID